MPAVKAIRHPPLFPPETISHRESCNLTGHSDWIWSVAFCPNGREIVSGSRDGTVRLWRLPDGPDVNDTAQMVWAAKQGCKVFTVSVSEDGKFVASGGLDGRIVMWCAQTGLKVTELLHSRIGKDSELKSTRSRIWSVVFSPDSKRIASASGDGVVSVWCALTGEQLAGPFFGHIGSIYALAFSPDGRKLVSGGNDGSIRIWDSYSGSLVLPFIQLHTDPVRSLVWAPDGKAIFTASHDSTIRCVEPSTGALLHIYGGNGGPICSLDTSHDGKLLVSASRDNSVRLWSTTNFQQIGAPIQHSDWINTVSLSKDGRYLATAGAGFDVYIWKLRINENLAVGTPDVNDDGSDEGTLVGTTELNPEEFGAQDTPPIYTEKSIGTHGAPEYSRDVSPMVLKCTSSGHPKGKSYFEADTSHAPRLKRSNHFKRARKLFSRLLSVLVFRRTRTSKVNNSGPTAALRRMRERMVRLFLCQHRRI